MAAEERSMKRAILTTALLLALPAAVAARSAPDLEVGFPMVNDSSPVEGGRFTLSVTVGNFGDGESVATTLRYYQSTDATISSADTQVGTDAVAAHRTSADYFFRIVKGPYMSGHVDRRYTIDTPKTMKVG